MVADDPYVTGTGNVANHQCGHHAGAGCGPTATKEGKSQRDVAGVPSIQASFSCQAQCGEIFFWAFLYTWSLSSLSFQDPLSVSGFLLHSVQCTPMSPIILIPPFSAFPPKVSHFFPLFPQRSSFIIFLQSLTPGQFCTDDFFPRRVRRGASLRPSIAASVTSFFVFYFWRYCSASHLPPAAVLPDGEEPS